MNGEMQEVSTTVQHGGFQPVLQFSQLHVEVEVGGSGKELEAVNT